MIATTMPAGFRHGLCALYALAWSSGLGFFVLHTWFVVDGDFGPQQHPWQYTALQIHGGAAFLMMITFGFVLGAHVQYAWKPQGKNIFGIALITLSAILMMTAYLLYYIAADEFRELLGYVHLAVGFFLPLALILHLRKKPASGVRAN
ncbi:MAG: hypothetical protein JKX92_02700 [Porticoccaceae bacterium]|nr:hypothetical protein [Porticoccaceae bacterium]